MQLSFPSFPTMLLPQNLFKSSSKLNDILSKRPIPPDDFSNPSSSQNLSVVKILSQAKFPIYLTLSKVDNKNYVTKVFPHTETGVSANYKNEMRFASLKHPNVIDMVHCERERETMQKSGMKKVSCITMEYAPYGDFFDFIMKYKDQIDDKLARTYFRQLINGIEYLHGRGVAHLDIKPENLLLGADFNLKIADFDISYIYGDETILSKGTKYYRAPEFFSTGSSRVNLEMPFAADIYSAGVFLFIIKNGGFYPHFEGTAVEGVEFYDLMYKDNKKFWKKHCELEDKNKSFYDDNFRKLFNKMVKLRPSDRYTIKKIKESKWFNGPVYTAAELHEKMKTILGC